MLSKFSLIAFFGLLGVFSRYFLGILAQRFMPSPFPYATFSINIGGAFFIGVIYVLGVERSFISPDLRIALIVGFLGGFTTFSSYCLEGVRLIEESRYFYAILYLGGSPFLGVIATSAGILMARKLLGGAL